MRNSKLSVVVIVDDCVCTVVASVAVPSVPAVPAVAAVFAVAAVAVDAVCALAVVEIMLVFHDISVLSAGVVPAHETSKSEVKMMMIDKSFFILTSEKSIVWAS